MENKDLKKLLENLFSNKNEYIIIRREDALLLKEAVEDLMETYSNPHIRKNIRSREDILELMSQFSSKKILNWLDRANEAGINYPYLSFELNERGISVSQTALASPSTIGGIVAVIENKMKEKDHE